MPASPHLLPQFSRQAQGAYRDVSCGGWVLVPIPEKARVINSSARE